MPGTGAPLYRRPLLLLALVGACTVLPLSCTSAPAALSAPAAGGPGADVVEVGGRVWTLGESVEFTGTVAQADLAGAAAPRGVFGGREDGASVALPDAVALAAGRELRERGGTGLMVTQFLVDEVREAGALSYRVEGWGRLAEPGGALRSASAAAERPTERQQVRRMVEAMASEDEAPTPAREPLPAMVVDDEPAASTVPAPASRERSRVRHGLELGSVVGYKMSIRPRSTSLDAVALRLMVAQINLYGGYYPLPGFGGVGLQVETGRDRPMQGVFGLEVANGTYSEFVAVPAALVGFQSDADGPFEFELGAAVGLYEGSILNIRPHLSLGWLW